jgi:hypothetical protein
MNFIQPVRQGIRTSYGIPVYAVLHVTSDTMAKRVSSNAIRYSTYTYIERADRTFKEMLLLLKQMCLALLRGVNIRYKDQIYQEP